MPFDLKGAYRIVIDLIYMCGGELPDDPRYISGHLGCSVRAWNGYRKTLVEMGKLKVENEIISNFRADKELIITRSFQDNQREKASKPRKNNTLCASVAQPKPSHTEPEPYKKELGKPNSIGFSEFWPIWPNKTAKSSAEKAWRNLSQPDRAAAIENAVPWFNGWRIRNPHASPIHPATYLNQKRWTDETQTSLTLIPGARHEQPTRSASTLAAFIGGAAGAS